MNKNLFPTASSKKKINVPATNTVNNAGGRAYSKTAEQSLATYVATGCLNSTYYTSAKEQLDTLINLLNSNSNEFIAKCAIYSRTEGLMKDMPVVLTAYLIAQNWHLTSPENKTKLAYTFNQSVDDVKQLQKFAQVIRSGVMGRKSFGSFAKKLIEAKLSRMTDEQLFKNDIGTNPSLGDIIKMVHPSPANPNGPAGNKAREALYSYIMGGTRHAENLPSCVQEFEAFKKSLTSLNMKYVHVPNLRFEKLASLNLSSYNWAELFQNMSYGALIKNLNTATRHGALTETTAQLFADRIANSDSITRTKAQPYQLYTSFKYAENLPDVVVNALERAAELAISNIPEISGNIAIAVDTSGSMQSIITGSRGSASSKMRCVDVASFIASSIYRINQSRTKIYAFDTELHNFKPSNTSILANTNALSKFGGGGTNCSLVMEQLLRTKEKVDLIIYLSDNESWADRQQYFGAAGTGLRSLFEQYRNKVNKNAKLVLLDLTPSTTTQAAPDSNILLIAGFNDKVFSIIPEFMKSNDPDFWISTISKVQL